MNSDDSPLCLHAVGMCKDYGPVRVLDDVELVVKSGEVHALLGANGAGKSTLCRIIAGLTPASAGTMILRGEPFLPVSKHAAERRGVQIIQQELNLIPTLTVGENLALNRLPHFAGVIRHAKLRQTARRALERVGLDDIDPDCLVGTLGIGTQQMLEVAAALDRQCRLLILDEPTAALSVRETEKLFEWLERLKQQGVGMLYVSHRLDEVKQVSDRVSVLRDGQLIDTRSASGLSTRTMVELMTGEEKSENETAGGSSSQSGELALEIRGLTREPSFREVSFQLHRGERLGIAGLVGSGRTELLRAIFGADRADRGSVMLAGSDRFRPFSSPRQAVRAGYGHGDGRSQSDRFVVVPVDSG